MKVLKSRGICQVRSIKTPWIFGFKKKSGKNGTEGGQSYTPLGMLDQIQRVWHSQFCRFRNLVTFVYQIFNDWP